MIQQGRIRLIGHVPHIFYIFPNSGDEIYKLREVSEPHGEEYEGSCLWDVSLRSLVIMTNDLQEPAASIVIVQAT
jgi:hypothetical protein